MSDEPEEPAEQALGAATAATTGGEQQGGSSATGNEEGNVYIIYRYVDNNEFMLRSRFLDTFFSPALLLLSLPLSNLVYNIRFLLYILPSRKSFEQSLQIKL